MMFSLGLGLIPRPVRRQHSQPAPKIMLVIADLGTVAQASGAGILTLTIVAPAPHAGSYDIDPARLANGPLCLRPPVLQMGDQAVLVTPGLWACLEGAIPPVFSGQWLANNAALVGQTGSTLALKDSHAGRHVTYAEALRQDERETITVSDAVKIPEIPAPQPHDVRLVPLPDATLEAEIGTKGSVAIKIDQPADYAGSYLVDPVDLADGPVCLVPPQIGLDPETARPQITQPGLWTYDPQQGALQLDYEWLASAPAAKGGMSPTETSISVIERGSQAHGRREAVSNTVTYLAQAAPDALARNVGQAQTLTDEVA